MTDSPKPGTPLPPALRRFFSWVRQQEKKAKAEKARTESARACRAFALSVGASRVRKERQ